jgi:hypothetical protein
MRARLLAQLPQRIAVGVASSSLGMDMDQGTSRARSRQSCLAHNSSPPVGFKENLGDDILAVGCSPRTSRNNRRTFSTSLPGARLGGNASACGYGIGRHLQACVGCRPSRWRAGKVLGHAAREVGLVRLGVQSSSMPLEAREAAWSCCVLANDGLIYDGA